jgi:hypothetical protein
MVLRGITMIKKNKIKADILTAQQIGRAVRGWYASELFNERGSMEEVPAGKIYVEDFEKTFPKDDKVIPVKYSDIYKIERFDLIRIEYKDINNSSYTLYYKNGGPIDQETYYSIISSTDTKKQYKINELKPIDIQKYINSL